MTKEQTALLERVQTLAPGFYTERDGGDWYIVTPDHCERIGEDFVSRDEARQALLSLAGEAFPAHWYTTPGGTGRIAADLYGPKGTRATLWRRPIAKHFPNALERLPIREG
jgi:hypothetical protein